MSEPGVFTYKTDAPPSISGASKDKSSELLPLYNDQNPLLALVQPEVNLSKPETSLAAIAAMCKRLLLTMTHYNGAGLAAPQCGIAARIFVLSGNIICINPVIVESSKETAHQKEGCLSFPGLILPVTRSVSARFKYTDETGKRIDVTWTGATARVALHEMDHLNGIVFTQRVGTLTLAMAKKKKQKLFKKINMAMEAKARQQQGPPVPRHIQSTPTHSTHQNGPVVTAVQSHREN